MKCDLINTKRCNECYDKNFLSFWKWKQLPEETHMKVLGDDPIGFINIIGKPRDTRIPMCERFYPEDFK